MANLASIKKRLRISTRRSAINTQGAGAYYNRGIAHKVIGEYEKARTDFQRALELATEQGHEALAQDAQRLLDELPPASGED